MPTPRKPTTLKILQGNPGKRPLPANEPKPELGAKMPETLSAEARAEWSRIAPKLEACGVLTNIDGQALAMYCETWARWMQSGEHLRRHGLLIETPTGRTAQSPMLVIHNTAARQLRELLVEFGMTPASRSRVSAASRPSPTQAAWSRLKSTISKPAEE